MNRKCFYVAHIRPAGHNPSPRSDLAAEPSKDSGGDYQPGHGGNPRLAGQTGPKALAIMSREVASTQETER